MRKIIILFFVLLMVSNGLSNTKESTKDPFLIEVRKAGLNNLKKIASLWLDNNQSKLIQMNQLLWEYAEVAMMEYKSSTLLMNYLEENGFLVERGVAGMPTAFVATYGQGEPVIGVLAEYDALPGLSQDKEPFKKVLNEGTGGHGCGHNLFGIASTAAAIAVKEVMKDKKIKGTIKLFGCPAEETVVGKVFMARDGVFNHLSCCLNWHPSSKNRVSLGSSNALKQFEVEFFGKTAHSAGDPWNGRSALDAVELTNIGLNYLREHLKPTARIHYVILKGGDAPNVVPGYAKAWYYIRDVDWESVKEDFKKIVNIIKGASLMTDTKYKIHIKSGVHAVLPNRVGSEVMYSNLLLVGAPDFSRSDQKFARIIQQNLGVKQEGLSIRIEPFKIPQRSWGGGSTDVAEVSWLTPTIGLGIAFKPLGTPGHHWSAVACSGMSIGQKSFLTSAKIMAFTALDLYKKPSVIEKMRSEWKKETKLKAYESPIPKDLKPPVKKRQD